MKLSKSLATSLCLIFSFTACTTNDNDSSAKQEKQESSSISEAKTNSDKPVQYAESIKDSKCNLLTREEVGELTGVAPSSLEEKLSGCFYSWEGTSDLAEGTIYLSSLRVYDTEQQAKRRYDASTKDVSSAEMKQAKKDYKAEAGDKSKRARLVDSMPEGNFSHNALEGIGSEAVMDNRGTVYIRSGNLILKFSGKTDGEDKIAPELAAKVGKRIMKNLAAL